MSMEVSAGRLRMIAAALLAGAAGVLSGGGWYTLGSIVELVWRHAAWLLVGLAAVNLLPPWRPGAR